MSENIDSLVNNGSTWLPGSYSTLSSIVDSQFYFIMWVSVFFTVLITVVTILFSIKYKRTKDNLIAKKQVTHNNRLE